jgi:rod shape-determining protein MreD
MRWLAYFILAYVAIGVQIGLGPYVQYRGAQPNFVLLAAVFVGLNAPRDAALLGCFCMGLIQDLVTQQPPGLFALSYGLTGLVVVGSHHVLQREHWLTHLVLALVGGLLTALVLVLHAWAHPDVPRGSAPGAAAGATTLPAIRLSAGTEFVRALYTAALAPLVLGLLQRGRRFFAFQPQRRKARPW